MPKDGESLQYYLEGCEIGGSQQSPKARYILLKYTQGWYASQNFDNLQDYDNGNPHPSQPYAFDSERVVEQTPQEIK